MIRMRLTRLLEMLGDDGVSTIDASGTDAHPTLQTKKGVRLSILHLKTIHGFESSPIFYERRPCLSEKAHIESRHEKSHKNNRRIQVLEAANRSPQVATRESHRHWRRHYMVATYNKSL